MMTIYLMCGNWERERGWHDFPFPIFCKKSVKFWLEKTMIAHQSRVSAKVILVAKYLGQNGSYDRVHMLATICPS
jgi:hypothetical protein